MSKHISGRDKASCPKCGFLGSLAKPWRVPLRETDELGRKGKIIGFEVYPSGCLCGPTHTEQLDERSYKLNLMPWRKSKRGSMSR